MFDIGFWEFALIGVVALVVVGPDRLPEMVRTVGQLIGRAKRTMRELKYDLERSAEFEEIGRLKKDFSNKSSDDITGSISKSIDIDDQIKLDEKTDS
ncbi:MAG: Sec-independent protein translocase protein TatB [Proteobacteria bacterium]|nr:Sec-independent protein translocase protein TatB [Pseudomonadota bacterium]